MPKFVSFLGANEICAFVDYAKDSAHVGYLLCLVDKSVNYYLLSA